MNLEGDLYQWIGKTSTELTDELGEPDRIDVSAYNYEWYVYNNSESQYGQFGFWEMRLYQFMLSEKTWRFPQ